MATVISIIFICVFLINMNLNGGWTPPPAALHFSLLYFLPLSERKFMVSVQLKGCVSPEASRTPVQDEDCDGRRSQNCTEQSQSRQGRRWVSIRTRTQRTVRAVRRLWDRTHTESRLDDTIVQKTDSKCMWQSMKTERRQGLFWKLEAGGDYLRYADDTALLADSK